MQERRLFVAILLCMCVVFAWQILFPPPTPKTRPRNASDTVAVSAFDTAPAAAQDSVPVDVMVAQDSLIIEEADSPAITLHYESQRYGVTLFETGGYIQSLTLNEYRYSHEKRNEPVELIYSSGELGHFAITMDETDRSGLSMTRWSSRWESDSVFFSLIPRSAELPAEILLEKKFEFDNSRYGFGFVVSVTNRSNRDQALSMARMTDGLYEADREGSLIIHFGPDRDQYTVSGSFSRLGKKEAAVFEKSWWHSLFGLPEPATGVTWAAFENRYFALALEPVGFSVDAIYSLDKKRREHLWIVMPAVSLKPGERRDFRFRVFAGPKQTQVLESFDPGFRMLDGMEPSILPRSISIARWMVALLGWIHGWIHNWGFSIILLTLFVRILLYPLSFYQFRSMAKMQKLKPRVEAIQAQYANDKERLQRELLNVYREAGVNPLGGCLPILLQMPILVGLFIALQNAIELRGVPFVLWITDLSIPDTIVHLLGIPINPLPLILCVTMYYQQKITPMPSSDPAQKQMMAMMPVIMTVLFYNFPSGLSLYWVTQNILSIAQQVYMMRFREVGNDGSR